MRKCRFESCDRSFEPVMARQVYCDSEKCKENRERERHRKRRERYKKQKEAQQLLANN